MSVVLRQAVARSGRWLAAAALALLAGTAPAAAQAPAPAPAPPPPPTTFLKRGALLGDWGGARTKMGEMGTKVDVSYTQFFDWSPVGDDDRGFDYGGKLDVKVQSSLNKLLGEGFSVAGQVELRSGDVPLLAGGTLIPTSTALLFPESSGTHAKVSALYGTQVFDDKFVLQFGRFNTLALYSAHPFTGGEGLDRFMNLSLVAPPISARTVPPSTEGVMFSVLKGAHPALTLGLIESTGDGFFENGATFMWNAALPVKLSKTLPGGVSVGGEIGSFEGTALDQTPWVFIPPLGIPVKTVQGAWTLNVSVDQFVWMHPNDPTKGMGVFGMFAVSDGNPSILRTQTFVGFGGAAPFEGRSSDSFGAAFYYNDISNALQDTLQPIEALRIRNEQGVELYYAWAPVGWSRVTADLQIIDPFLLRSESRLFFAIRWKVIF
jgi:porin